ncbi:MAG: inositol monophosphatase family protein [Alphaproteobacteria bacterium]
MQEFLELATELAEEAGKIARNYYRQPFEVISKGDESPVTIADRTIEQRLREILEHKRPQDGIIGEEYGTKPSQSGLNWVIDPIDGTKSFVIGRPTFGTLIALWEGEDAALLGLIDQPISQERWIGAKNFQTQYNGQPCKTRPCKELALACCASTTPAMFEAVKPVYWDIEKQTKMMAWGGDCYMYGLIASGHMDLAVEAALSPYDFAALVPVIESAGGFICDWQGAPLTLTSNGCVIAGGDPAIKETVLEIIQTA